MCPRCRGELGVLVLDRGSPEGKNLLRLLGWRPPADILTIVVSHEDMEDLMRRGLVHKCIVG